MRPTAAGLLQIARFGAVGIAATAVHYLVALPVTWLVTPYLGNVAGYLVALGVSYAGHHRFTFRVPTNEAAHRHRMPRFILVSATALLLSQAVLALARAGGLPDELALLAAVATIPAVTFTVGRLWVFA